MSNRDKLPPIADVIADFRRLSPMVRKCFAENVAEISEEHRLDLVTLLVAGIWAGTTGDRPTRLLVADVLACKFPDVVIQGLTIAYGEAFVDAIASKHSSGN